MMHRRRRKASRNDGFSAKVSHGLVFEFAMISGMRPEEYLSLMWSDLHFFNNRVSVKRALLLLKGGGFKFGNPKTKNRAGQFQCLKI